MRSAHNKLRAFFRDVRAVVWAILDGLVLFALPYRPRKNTVLIIRVDAIGDFVLWLDAARALVSYYHAQGYSVVLLGNQTWASWAREMGVADEVLEIDTSRFKKHLTYRWQWLNRIRKAGFNIAIQPVYSRVFIDGDSLLRASGASERIGSTGDASNFTALWFKSWSNRWFTRLIPATPGLLMELKRNAEFMRGLGIADFQARLPTIPLVSDTRVDKLPLQPYAVIVPATSWDGKSWSIDKFVIIAHRLEMSGFRIVVVGGHADHERVNGLMEALSGEYVDLVGKTSLGELAEVFRCAALVLTNDTSGVHIAVAVDAPVVCILGGGHFGRFAPYEIEMPENNRKLPIFVVEPMICFGCNWRCQYPRQNGEPVKCIQDISVDKVWQSVGMALLSCSSYSTECNDA